MRRSPCHCRLRWSRLSSGVSRGPPNTPWAMLPRPIGFISVHFMGRKCFPRRLSAQGRWQYS
eukprot:9476645-Pyramimonas_sp.AAC.2